MSWKDLFLSFEGRINRARYWLATLVIFVTILFAMIVILAIAAEDTVVVAALLVFVPFVYVGLAVAAKRLHDRDKSAWWLTLFYGAPALLGHGAEAVGEATTAGLVMSGVASLIGLWAIVELGFLRGTAGRNRFGHDPLKPGTADARI